MPTILTHKFKYKNATSVRRLFHDVDDKGNLKHHVYLFIARNRAWGNGDTPEDPNTLVSLQDEMDVYNDIIVLKKLSASDVSIIVPQYKWVSGTGYTTWEHNDSTIFDRDGDPTQPFYVVTQESSGDWSVWKCLMNVNGESSTVEPTISSNLSDKHIKSSNDGFVWKYMYSISNAQYLKFGGSEVEINGNKWMPIKTLFAAPSAVDNNSTTSQWDVQRQAVHGGVHLVKPTTSIITAGSFVVGKTYTIVSIGTTDFTLIGADSNPAVGEIFTATGLGSGDGTARGLATTYTSTDEGKLVRLDGDGTGFEADISTIVIGGNTHYYVNITDPGQDYTYVRRVMVQQNSGGSSSFPSDFDADTSLSAILAPIGGHGWDAVEELGGHRMMIYTTLPGNTDFGEQGTGYQHKYADDVDTDYRTVGLLVDPIKSRDGYDDIVNGATKGEVVMTGDRQLEPDATNVARLHYTGTFTTNLADAEWIGKEVMQVGSNGTFQAIGRVVDHDPVGDYFYVIPYAGTTIHTQFEADTSAPVYVHNTNGTLDTSNSFTVDAVKPNDILPFSGDIIYLDNRAKITRDEGKTETVRIIIEF